MKIIYTGAEIGSNRTVLESMGVTHMGVSYARMVKRGMPKTKKWLVSERFDSSAVVVAYPGVSETKNFGIGELENFAVGYQEWVVDNAERLAGFIEFDPPQLGHSWVKEQRSFWADAGDQFWPVWAPDSGFPDLVELSQEFSNIAITHKALESETSLSARTRALTSTHGTVWHGLAIASPENLRQVQFSTASTGSWQSPMRRGETIVWDGTRLVRYPKAMKDQARKRYRALITSAGLDYDAVVADDPKEVTRLAIWSYQQLENSMNKKTHNPANNLHIIDGGKPEASAPTDVDNSEMLMTGLGGMLFGDVDNSGTEVRKLENRIPEPRMASERQYLPVMTVESTQVVEVAADGTETVRQAPILGSTSTSLRQCNTCFVAANCPAFKDNSECAFGLPIEIKTKDQLKALLNTVVEMQGSRVAFARFSEELNGGYPDPNVSQEIDRLFKLVEQLKKMEDNREFVRMTFERQGGAGVLSSIFGDRAQALKEIDGGGYDGEQTTQLIQQAFEE